MDFDKNDEKRICRDSLEMRRPTALVIAFVRTIHHGRGTVAMIPARRFRYPKRIEFARGRTRRINISMLEGPFPCMASQWAIIRSWFVLGEPP